MTSTLADALSRYASLVDDRTGVIAGVQLPALEDGDPPVHIALSIPPRTGLSPATGPGKIEGSGAALDRERALVKALGESTERYAAGFPPAHTTFGPAHRLDVPHVCPDAFALFSPEQHAVGAVPFTPFTASTPVLWEPAVGLADGRRTWVPSCFVRFPYRRRAGEAHIATGISTGLAAGTRLSDALVSAVCEVVERDAFMLFWRHERPVPAIDVRSLPDDPHGRLLDALASAGLSCTALLITQDIRVPVVLLRLGAADGGPPYVLLAAGAHPDPLRACHLALEEACLCVFGTRRLRRRLADLDLGDPAKLNNLTAQALAFGYDPSYRKAADALLSGHGAVLDVKDLVALFPPTGPAPGCRPLDRLLDALGPWARHACYVDLTRQDLREAGLRAVRALVPGLVPLDHDSTRPHLGGARIRDRPVRLGPHPFP